MHKIRKMFSTRNQLGIRFVSPSSASFYAALKQRVDAYFTENQLSKSGNTGLIVKTLVLFTGYLLPPVLVYSLNLPFGVSVPLWIFAGVSLAGIGMSVMHDAVHGAYAKNERLNLVLGYFSLNMLGASLPNWKLQHNVLHHTFTNISQVDEDIDDKAMLRMSPHTRQKSIQRFQWIYAFFIYGLTTLYWVSVKDFLQFARYRRNGVSKRSKAGDAIVLTRMILMKMAYAFMLIVLPILLGYSALVVVGGFLIMHFTAGFILTVIFQLAHTVEGTSHRLPDSSGAIENEWAIHQLNTTVDFSPNNRLLSWYCGGLNFQVEHHLFPKICHVHYPALSKIVSETAQEFGLKHMVNPTFSQAFVSHVRTLKRFGHTPSLMDALD